MRRWLAVALLFAAAAPAAVELPPEVRDDVLLRALADEMNRTVSRLRMEPFDGPHFIAFRVEDATNVYAFAQFGAAQNRSRSRSRGIRVDLRVGSPELIENVRRRKPDVDPSDPVSVLAAVRALKDEF